VTHGLFLTQKFFAYDKRALKARELVEISFWEKEHFCPAFCCSGQNGWSGLQGEKPHALTADW
jgi:hypothetical protein